MAPPKQSTNKVAADAAEVASQGDAPAVGRTRHCLLSQLHKTKFCTYHLKGTCQYGKSCAFAHSYTELQGTPDLRKTRLCPMFQENGTCTNAGCTFAHGEDELRSTAMFFRKTLCIWNEKGRCRNGDQCRFAHGKEQLRAAGKSSAATAVKGIATLETPGRRQRQVSDKSGRSHDTSGGSTCIGSGASSCSDEPMKINVGTMVEGAAPAPPPGLENGRRTGETLQQLDELRHNLSRALRAVDTKGAVVDAYFDPLLMGMGGYGFRGGLPEFVQRGFGDAGMHNPAAMGAEPTYLGDPRMDGALAASLAQNLWGYGDSQALLGW